MQHIQAISFFFQNTQTSKSRSCWFTFGSIIWIWNSTQWDIDFIFLKLKHNQFFCCQIYHHWKYHFNRSTLILAFAVSTLQCHASCIWLNCSCYESRPVKHSSLYLEKDPIIYKIHLKYFLLILSNFCKI